MSINFALAYPSTKDLPLDLFNNALTNIINLKNPEILQYGNNKGHDSLLEKLTIWLSKKYNTKISKNQILMTNGNTGAIQLLMDTYIESGDEIIMEYPCVPHVKKMFEEFGLNINSINDIEQLEEKIKSIIQNDDRNLQNKIFLYIMPSLLLSEIKKNQLSDLCSKYPKFHIISDESYSFLNFNQKSNMTPLANYHSKIFSLGSFSKILGPGLRVGWIYTENLIDRLSNTSFLNSSGGLNPIGFLIVEQMLSDIDTILSNQINNLSIKCDIMYDFIINNFKDIQVIKPEEGYFLWLKLQIKDTKDFLTFAQTFKVMFHPEENGYIRLCFSYYDSNEILTGLNRLLEAYKLYKKIKITIFEKDSNFENEISKDNRFHITKDINITDLVVIYSTNEETVNVIKSLIKDDINITVLIGSPNLSVDSMKLIKIYSYKNCVGIVPNFSANKNKIENLLSSIDTKEFKIEITQNNNDKNCIKYICWILLKNISGLYHDESFKTDYHIITVLDNQFLITENTNYVKNNYNSDYVLLIKDTKDNNFSWTVFDNYGEETMSNSNDLLAISKYANTFYHINKGKLNNKNGFKIDGTKYYLDFPSPPSTEDLDKEEAKSLKNLINQLSGLNVVGTGKFELNTSLIMIEIAEDIDIIDTEILTTLGSIINSDICYLNIKENNQIRVRFYNKNTGKESNGILYGCIAAFDFYAYINDLSYDNVLEGIIIMNNDVIKIIYNLNKYFLVY